MAVFRFFACLFLLLLSSASFAVDTDIGGILSTGYAHNCALDDTGVVCWGGNYNGQTDVPSLSNPTQVSSGGSNTCALDDTGVVCWGNNSHGQIDMSSLINPSQISLGYDGNSCALDDTGVVCWGDDIYSTGKNDVPPLSNPTQVHTYRYNSCALDDTGVVCWGSNSNGKTDVPSLSNPTQVSLSEAHICALDDTGVVCWGSTRFGQTNVPSLSNPRQVGSGDSFSCALDDTGVVCWGYNYFGQTDVPWLSNPYQMSVGAYHVCALDDTGVVCWGYNDSGQTDVPELTFTFDEDVTDTDNCPDIDNPDQLGTDGDSIGDACDSDNDNDGYLDINDAFPFNALEWLDSDNDGYGDNSDNCPMVYQINQYNNDGDSMGNVCDPDDDNDGYADIDDAFPFNALEWLDSDNDQLGNNSDNCPFVHNYDQNNYDGDSMGNVCDPDDDNDGYADIDDAFPFNALEWLDSDNDQLGNNSDNCPFVHNYDQNNYDGDSMGNACDPDDDNDGYLDINDAFIFDPTEWLDTDSDGIGNNADTDDDNDGIPDGNDAYPLNKLYSVDTDNDGMPDRWEMLYKLNLNDSADAVSDHDGDGTNALQEFLAGTIPKFIRFIDIDANDSFDALTDGLIILRYAFGLRGQMLINDAISSDALRTNPGMIEQYIEHLIIENNPQSKVNIDIDVNGSFDALTDGLIILRYAFGLRGQSLVDGATAGDAMRTEAADVEAYLNSLVPGL